MVVKTTYRRRYVRAYYQMRTGFLRSTVYCTGDKVGVPHALKANRRMNNNKYLRRSVRYLARPFATLRGRDSSLRLLEIFPTAGFSIFWVVFILIGSREQGTERQYLSSG